jgi:biopolymer transport protein ExbD
MAKRQPKKSTKTKVETLSQATKKALKKRTASTKNLQAKNQKKAQKHKKNDNFIRLSENAKFERFVEMGERIKRGEIVWSYFALDGNVGYHYYRKK